MENGNCSAVVQQNGMVVVQNGLDEDNKYIKLVFLIYFAHLTQIFLENYLKFKLTLWIINKKIIKLKWVNEQ